MKGMLLIGMLLMTTFIFGQTKEETEDWIIQKYNEYERPCNTIMDLWFEDGYLFYYWSVDGRSPNETRIALIYKIKIKDIVSVKTSTKKLDAPEVISLFTIYTKKKAVTIKSLPEESVFKPTYDSVEIALLIDFVNEGVKARMEKAFLHLVKLYGGTATVKKEAF